ncbi:ATP synthase F0 subunit B [Candidatus Uhrbacteria bacterium CG_4_9_14_3_um_filter_50_9]|uniref:ATP synthase subunit b n=1 Tax=Candidatus Uhrbacteria bacterium CG_4_9_14_3_um_filter_50_9 TaxID=1975035 RepID=A0A2M7XDB5_9BACT|nr:MAG: ATP synthase F0 subunit B [Candidatus Uhrbacteria bacterium CG_4_9_14_3_um_filter_50_9]
MSNEIQLAAEAATEVANATEATGGLGTLGINLKIFIAQLVNFTVVLLVLWKWAYTPIVKLLDERSEKIEKSVKQAEAIDKRVNELAEEQKSIVVQAKGEANKILELARTEAEERKQTLLEKAKADVHHVVAQGKNQLQAEKEQMIIDAREQIALIAVEASRKILSESIDEKKAQALAEGVIDDMTHVV